ncbi:Ribosomal protein L15 like protein [Aduncisulcus paluster]|uniref:Ribosomal protein L15 like protein n=1 Tax=Aduncisulcus paluster TaxID=2918883 RepID=A0ABQ5K0A3_9EUKA|nr:Ribosomal protein L15 like protein [Aduncisulcus paluster]
MVSRLSKNRKKRGHVSAGHGRIGKHRCHPGGRGKAGGFHHHRTFMLKFHPGSLGKQGMRHYHVRAGEYHCPTINLDQIWTLVPEELRSQHLEAKDSKNALVIDVTKFGFHKVLGRGRLPKCPVIIRAKEFSKIACQKISAVEGVAELSA